MKRYPGACQNGGNAAQHNVGEGPTARNVVTSRCPASGKGHWSGRWVMCSIGWRWWYEDNARFERCQGGRDNHDEDEKSNWSVFIALIHWPRASNSYACNLCGERKIVGSWRKDDSYAVSGSFRKLGGRSALELSCEFFLPLILIDKWSSQKMSWWWMYQRSWFRQNHSQWSATSATTLNQ